jgi:phytoene synthase
MCDHTPTPLAAIVDLVQGCQTATQQNASPAYFPNRAMPQRVAWMLDLFERRETERLDRNALRQTA